MPGPSELLLCGPPSSVLVQEGFQLRGQDIRLPKEVTGWEPWQGFGLCKSFGSYVSQAQSKSGTILAEPSLYGSVSADLVLM